MKSTGGDSFPVAAAVNGEEWALSASLFCQFTLR